MTTGQFFSGGGGSSTASDPYGLQSNTQAVASEEFSSTDLGSWILTQPGTGTITAEAGNGKLEMKCGATSDLGSFLIPLADFGGGWVDGSTIFESAFQVARGLGICRLNFCVTDGVALTSHAVQFNFATGDGTVPRIYTFVGTPNSPFGVSYTEHGYAPDNIRARILSSGAGTIRLQVSMAGTVWEDLTGGDVSIGWTPTHVGFLFGSAGHALGAVDYVRRLSVPV